LIVRDRAHRGFGRFGGGDRYSTTAANDKSAWIHGSVYLGFPEGEAREWVLFDLVQQFSKMAPEDLEWLRYRLCAVECHALENVARGWNHAAAEQARLRVVTREIADCAAAQMKGPSKRPGGRSGNFWRMSRPVSIIPLRGRPSSSATQRSAAGVRHHHPCHHRIVPGAGSCNVA
jgi:NADH:ubiquinone oxidoreductase subunit